MAEGEVDRELQDQKRAIFNARDNLDHRVPQLYLSRLEDLLLFNAEGFVHNLENAFELPIPKYLEDPGYLMVPFNQVTDRKTMEESNHPPCFFPVETDLEKVGVNRWTQAWIAEEMWKANFEGDVLPDYDGSYWTLFHGEPEPTLHRAVNKTRRFRESRRLSNADAMNCAQHLTPPRDIYMDFTGQTGKVEFLQQYIEELDINEKFVGRVNYEIIRKNARAKPKPVIQEPTAQQALDQLHIVLQIHFNISSEAKEDKLMRDMLDYLCPKVLDYIPEVKTKKKKEEEKPNKKEEKPKKREKKPKKRERKRY